MKIYPLRVGLAIHAFLLIVHVHTAMAAGSTLDDLLARTIIVRARVIEVKGTEKYSTSTQRIEHLYSGALREGISSFEDSSAEQSSTGGPVWPALELGQVGLWLLRPRNDGQCVVRRAVPELGIRWPVRPGIDGHYEGVRMFAEAIEKVWNADIVADRTRLLKQYAQSDISEVSVGAIMLLAEGAPDELAKLTGDVNLRTLPLRTQLALDEAMIKFEPDNWRTSPKRARLLSAWQEQASEDETDALLILTRLDVAIQRKEITADEALNLLRPLATAQESRVNVRYRALGVIRWIVNDPVVRDHVFDLVAGILESDDETRLKFAAAQSFSGVQTLKDEQMARLSVLRDQYVTQAAEVKEAHAPVKQIASALDAALRSAAKPRTQ